MQKYTGHCIGRTSFRGVTLIETLVAALIMLVAISGTVAAWAQMMRTTLASDNRGMGYEVARQVMERSRSLNFYQAEPTVIVHPINSANNPNLTSPLLARWRFFDEGLKEIMLPFNNYDGVDSGTAKPAAPAGARFCVLTRVTRNNPNQGHIPPDRPDLQIMAIEVQVYDARYPDDPAMYVMQDALAMGGI